MENVEGHFSQKSGTIKNLKIFLKAETKSVQSLNRNGANEKIRQNAENKQTFVLTGKIEFEGKTRQTLKIN